MRYDYDYVREHNPLMAVNDIIDINGAEYVVTSVQIEHNTGMLPIVEYTAQPRRNYETYIDITGNRFYPLYLERDNSISFRSLLNVSAGSHASTMIEDDNLSFAAEKEMSENTRQEFMKLLE